MGNIINTRRYGPLRGPTSSSYKGLLPSAEGFFCPLGKKNLIMLFLPIFGIFWCPVVTLVLLVVTLVTLKEIPIKPKKSKKKSKY